MQTENTIEAHETIPIRRYLAFMCAIGIGIVISFILFLMVKNWEQEDQRIKFESVVKGYANAVQNRLHGNVEALMFLGDSRESFRTVNSLAGKVREVLYQQE